MADPLTQSWTVFSRERAAIYLNGYGAPAESSKRLLLEVIRQHSPRAVPSLLDLGCGNAHVCTFFRDHGLDCSYTGVDVSPPLLEAAKANVGADATTRFVEDDICKLSGVVGHHDVAFYSHTLEMIGDPESSLRAAKRLADRIVIRFFEPPTHTTDSVDLRLLDVGGDASVPYIRRSMGRSYYQLMLANLGCDSVDVYQDDGSTDQIHVLNYS